MELSQFIINRLILFSRSDEKDVSATLAFRNLAGIFFDALLEKFGKSIITGGFIAGSVACGKATQNSDIDGRIIFLPSDPLDDTTAVEKLRERIRQYMSDLFKFTMEHYSTNFFPRSCDFMINIFTLEETLSCGCLTYGPKLVDIWTVSLSQRPPESYDYMDEYDVHQLRHTKPQSGK